MLKAICAHHFFNTQRNQWLPWGTPSLDVFAGPLPAEHVTEQFYTKYWCEQSRGADAFQHSWAVQHASRNYQMAWIFPPQDLITRTLMRLVRQPVHATVILPAKTAVWTALLLQLPIVAKHCIMPNSAPFSLGVGAPPGWTAARLGPFIAWRVWPGLRCSVDV